MKLRTLMTALLLGSPLFLAACSDSQAGYNESKDKYTYEQRDAFRTEMDQTLAKLDARIEQLREKTAQGGENLEAGTSALMEKSKESLTRLRQELSNVGSVTKDHWNDFKRSFGKTMDDLNRELDNALH